VEKQTDERLLARAFEKAAEYSLFIAADLRLYRSFNGMPNEKLASFLNCTTIGLYKLGLCKRPDPLSPSFRSQVEEIASYSGVNGQRLAQLLRETDTTKAMWTLSKNPTGTRSPAYLMAARDKEDSSQNAGRFRRRSKKSKKKKPKK